MNIASSTAINAQSTNGSYTFFSLNTLGNYATSTLNTGLTVATTTLVVNASEQRVGIGTTGPGQKLSVVDSGNDNTESGIASFFANNLTAGVSIGYSGITKVGSTANTNLNINANGTGHIVLQNTATGNVG